MPKHSIEWPVEHEITENVKSFHETQIYPLKKRVMKNLVNIVIVHNSIHCCWFSVSIPAVSLNRV